MIYFLLLFLLVMVFYTYKIFRYQSIWENIPLFEAKDNVDPQTKFSIIICARNEEKHLPALLQSIAELNYPKHLFEVLIIDDHSTDDTANIIQQFANQNSHIRYIPLAEYTHFYPPTLAFKKMAITVGVNISKNDYFVCTDADCVLPKDWLKVYDQVFQKTNWQFIASPVQLNTANSSVDIFQSLDFLTLQGITGAAVYKKMHIMSNGANMAFTRNAFNQVRGYEGVDHIPSGDDLLLMQKIISKFPDQYGYIKSNAIIVRTEAPKTWKELFNQRIRWASKIGHYSDKSITSTLVLVFVMNLCFVILCFCSFFAMKWFVFLCLLLSAKVLIEYPFVESIARFFNQQRYLKFFPLMQIPHIFYTVIAGVFGKLRKYEWKGRVIPTK